MKVIRLILLLPLDVLILLSIMLELLTSKIDEILKIAVIGLMEMRKKLREDCETTETSEVK